MINAYWEPLTFEIQEGVHGQWKRVIDTSLEAPHDICESGEARRIASPDLAVDARSIVVLLREKN
jgi:glycogen operon protein